ncbi:MAG: hypothetical protein LQ348_004962 [Seirophora lacunosa]|nr:MAG: hypothetical protein LQ348_004962 [Seirophora lacunosa]
MRDRLRPEWPTDDDSAHRDGFGSTQVQLAIPLYRFTKKIVGSGQAVLAPAEGVEAAEWIKKAWAKNDGLWTKLDAKYLAITIPELSTSGDPALDALLAAVAHVAEPERNTSIGFEERAFFRTRSASF